MGLLFMPTFAIELTGLSEIVKEYKNRIPKEIAVGIGRAAISLEGTITNRVVDTYSISTREVKAALVGKSTSLQKRGKNVLKAGIEYRYKPKPLHTFPYREFTVAANSRFIIPGRRSRFIKKTTAKAVAVAVRRGRYKTVIGKKGFGGFVQHKSSLSKWAEIQGGRSKSRPAGIYERQQDATWITEPSVRAPISRLFGPSVTEMILNILNYDSEVQRELENFDKIILKDFLK